MAKSKRKGKELIAGKYGEGDVLMLPHLAFKVTGFEIDGDEDEEEEALYVMMECTSDSSFTSYMSVAAVEELLDPSKKITKLEEEIKAKYEELTMLKDALGEVPDETEES